jgi:hypothetical protein
VSRNHVNPNAQKFLKFLDQCNLVKEGSTRFKVDQQVKIAVWTRLSLAAEPNTPIR